MGSEGQSIPRRTVVVGAGVIAGAAALAACAGSEPASKSPSGTGAPPPPQGSPPSSSPAPPAQPAAAGTPPGAVARVADVPVGSGVIAGEVVVTQPNPGNFEGYSVVCPHMGCAVNELSGGKIICPCHGSEFNLDGSVAVGPAVSGLAPRAVSVQGEWLVAGGGPAPALEQQPEQPQVQEQVTEASAPPGAVARASAVPVGSGVIAGGVVVTQPRRGNYQGFSSICPHAGCAVGTVSGGTINCLCHGSKFNLDGSVAVGPAVSGLAPRAVSVQGDWIVVGGGPAPTVEQPEQEQPAKQPEPTKPGSAIVRAAQVPVGGGVIVGDVMVTQPRPGDFRGMSSLCTHVGCVLDPPRGGIANCACHGSKFNLEGGVVSPPAFKPLPPRPVVVSGEWIVLKDGSAPGVPPPPRPIWCGAADFLGITGSSGC